MSVFVRVNGVDKLKVAQLKSFLKSLGVEAKGKKAELVEEVKAVMARSDVQARIGGGGAKKEEQIEG